MGGRTQGVTRGGFESRKGEDVAKTLYADVSPGDPPRVLRGRSSCRHKSAKAAPTSGTADKEAFEEVGRGPSARSRRLRRSPSASRTRARHRRKLVRLVKETFAVSEGPMPGWDLSPRQLEPTGPLA